MELAEFEKSVQKGLISKQDFLDSHIQIMVKHQWESTQSQWFFNVIKNHYDKYGEILSTYHIAQAIKKLPDKRAEIAKKYVKMVMKAKYRKLSADVIKEEVKQIIFKNSVEILVKMREENKYVDGLKFMEKVLTNPSVDEKPFKESWLIEDFEKRQKLRKHMKEHPEEYIWVKTFIKSLDKIIVGLRGGELGLIMATTNKGKSIFAVHLGFVGALQGYNILHITTEMDDVQTAARYDSRLFKMEHRKFKMYDFTKEDLEFIDRRFKKRKEKMAKKVHIVHIYVKAATVYDISKIIARRNREGIKTDLVIVDSGDHLKSMNKYDQPRLEHTEVYWALKWLADEYKIGVWSTVHASKEWAEKFAGAEASSESYDKSRISDLVLNLNQTSEQKMTNEMDLYLSKYRDGKSAIRIPLSTTFSHMIFKEVERMEGEDSEW